MATINLGRVKPVFQGAYSNTTAYVVDDIVTHDGNSYICILASTGNAPTNATYWTKMAAGSDLGGLSGLTAGDIAVYNGSSWTRQAIGTAGQALKVNSGANGFEFGSAGGIIQTVFSSQSGQNQSGTGTVVQEVATAFRVTMTPTSSSNKILVFAAMGFAVPSGARIGFMLYRSTDAGSSFSRCDNIGESHSEMYRNGSGGQIWHNQNILLTDSSPSTSQTIYTIYFEVNSAVSYGFGDNTGIQQVVAMEVQQ